MRSSWIARDRPGLTCTASSAVFSRAGWAAVDAFAEGKALNIQVLDKLIEGGFKSSYRTREPREDDDDDGSAEAAGRRD